MLVGRVLAALLASGLLEFRRAPSSPHVNGAGMHGSQRNSAPLRFIATRPFTGVGVQSWTRKSDPYVPGLSKDAAFRFALQRITFNVLPQRVSSKKCNATCPSQATLALIAVSSYW